MPAQLEPIRRFKCTYKDCDMSFDTEKLMKSHKKRSVEHEYCHKCDEDFDSFEEYAMHKITRPAEHGLACRVCGDEFKSSSGLKRHIELNHKVDQKLTCFGCHHSFYRASLFIEHLEFGHCTVISASQFQGHIVHKHLISELLKGGPALDRFRQKTSKYDAAIDNEEEGGVSLCDDPLDDDDDMEEVDFKAIKPNMPSDTPDTPVFFGQFPPLPSQSGSMKNADYEVSEAMGSLSLNDRDGTESDTSTVVVSPSTARVSTRSAPNLSTRHVSSVYSTSSTQNGSTAQESTTSSVHPELKVWGSRKGKSTGAMLFPNAKPKAPPSEFSIAAYDDSMEQEHGINILRSRFWDPMSTDWNPEKFFDAILCKYHCPFICEQKFDCAGDLNKHILSQHRITRMKCPKCLKHFNNVTALIAHCESQGARCEINKADDFNIFLDRMSGGFLSAESKIRPDHVNTKNVLLTNETGHMELYKPPVASYLQYTVTTPPDWKEPVHETVQIGGYQASSQW